MGVLQQNPIIMSDPKYKIGRHLFSSVHKPRRSWRDCTLSNTVPQQNRTEAVLGPCSGHAELLKVACAGSRQGIWVHCDEPAKISFTT